jgi:hypothetical protein
VQNPEFKLHYCQREKEREKERERERETMQGVEEGEVALARRSQSQLLLGI